MALNFKDKKSKFINFCYKCKLHINSKFQFERVNIFEDNEYEC